jgi:YgiT-type zinc finger domain-containing protein
MTNNKDDLMSETQSMKCPLCGNEMVRKKIRYFEKETGLDLGDKILFDADVCNHCGETFYTEDSSIRLDLIFMDIGVWGVPLPPLRNNIIETYSKFVNFDDLRYSPQQPPPKKLISI